MPQETNAPRATAAHARSQKKRHSAPRAKTGPKPCPAESCSHCGVTLGLGEAAFLWQSAVVCGECHARRQAAHVAAALAAPRLPLPDDDLRDRRPWWRRVIYGTRRLLSRPIAGARLRGGKGRRRDTPAAVEPLLACLQRSVHRV